MAQIRIFSFYSVHVRRAKKSKPSGLNIKQFFIQLLGEELYNQFIISAGYTDYENADLYETLYNYGMDDNKSGWTGLHIPWKNMVDKLYHIIGKNHFRFSNDVIEIKKIKEKPCLFQIKTANGTLYHSNKVIVANQLSFCFGYQQEEFFYYKDTMFIDSTQQWLPELFFKTPINILKSSSKNIGVVYEIGFFSSGNWLRDKLGDVDLGNDDLKNENSILNILVNFVCQNNLKMCIFLHPIEKKTENLNFSLKHYELILKNQNITIADINKSSINGFDKINIGIAQYSAIMFERIVLGYKTIIAPWGHSNFPIKNSTLSSCCALNESELIKKLNELLPITVSEYFIKTDLNKYVHNYKF